MWRYLDKSSRLWSLRCNWKVWLRYVLYNSGLHNKIPWYFTKDRRSNLSNITNGYFCDFFRDFNCPSIFENGMQLYISWDYICRGFFKIIMRNERKVGGPFNYNHIWHASDLTIRGFRKWHTIDNVDISGIFVNFVFQSGRDYSIEYGAH